MSDLKNKVIRFIKVKNSFNNYTIFKVGRLQVLRMLYCPNMLLHCLPDVIRPTIILTPLL